MNRSILDEYIKSRMGNADLDKYSSGGTSARKRAVVRPNPVPRKNQSPVYRPERYRRPDSIVKTIEKKSTAPYTTIPGIDAPTTDQEEGSNVLTWDDQIDIEIQNAANKVQEVANRKFQYSTRESPIYSIMRQEYLKEADLAAGRATAAAAQNAGGFGSSFAVMAGEEARRQVMEGFHDREDELYAAARDEQERLETHAPATITLEDGTTVEVTDAARELYAGYLDSFTQGTGYDTLKTAMINGGASEADADQAIAMFKKLSGATVADQISALEESPTLSGAAEAYLAASQKGTLDRDAAKISAGAKAAVEASLKNAGDDEEAMNTALAEAAQAVKDGYMSESDYVSIITADIHADIQNMESGDEKISDRKKRKRVAQSIEGIIAQYESGNLSDDGYQKALIAMKPYLEKYFGIKNGISMGDAMSIASMNKGEINAIMEAAKEIDKVSKKAKIAKERRG